MYWGTEARPPVLRLVERETATPADEAIPTTIVGRTPEREALKDAAQRRF